MNSDMIWIIVPVYNATTVLKKCVQSIRKQTYTNWKLILVDDGSTDQSGILCDTYAAEDTRIRVIHTENRGPSAARNTGVETMDQPGYCFFCDSDDELPPRALELLHKEAVRTQADMVCGRIVRMLRGVCIEKPQANYQEPVIYDNEAIMRDLFQACLGGGGFSVSLCAKLYKNDIIRTAMKNVKKAPSHFAEDLNITMNLLPMVKRLSIINEPVYRYRMGGGTSKFMPSFLNDNLLMYHNKMDMAHLCTYKYDARSLIGIELKNIAVTYLVMCAKHKHYTCGNLDGEIKMIYRLPEIQEIIPLLKYDHSGLAGISPALLQGDLDKVRELILDKVKRDKPKDLLKKLLCG